MGQCVIKRPPLWTAVLNPVALRRVCPPEGCWVLKPLSSLSPGVGTPGNSREAPGLQTRPSLSPPSWPGTSCPTPVPPTVTVPGHRRLWEQAQLTIRAGQRGRAVTPWGRMTHSEQDWEVNTPTLWPQEAGAVWGPLQAPLFLPHLLTPLLGFPAMAPY